MQSLNEMRSKFVELTGVKSEQSERIDNLEHAIRGRDATIAQFEATLEEAQQGMDEAENRSKEDAARLQKELLLAQSDSSMLQKAYAELQNELDVATASLYQLEAERSTHHQESTRRIEEIEQLNASSQAKSEELSAVRQELNARRDAQVSNHIYENDQ
jgi:myosin protein heavy chain